MCCEDIVSNAKRYEQAQRVTYLVKGQHLSSHLAAIVQSDSHPVVDLEGRHQCLHRTSGEAGRIIASMIGGHIYGQCTYVTGLRYHFVLAC